MMRFWWQRAKDSAPITMRSMGRKDIPQVLDIERRSYATPWTPENFRTEIEDNLCADYIVAVRGREVVGYAGMWRFLLDAHITNIAVAPDYREQGVGRLLLLGLMRRAHKVGLRKMTLEVRVSNQAARSFYLRYGFVATAIRKGYYTDNQEDAIRMYCDDIEAVLAAKGEPHEG